LRRGNHSAQITLCKSPRFLSSLSPLPTDSDNVPLRSLLAERTILGIHRVGRSAETFDLHQSVPSSTSRGSGPEGEQGRRFRSRARRAGSLESTSTRGAPPAPAPELDTARAAVEPIESLRNRDRLEQAPFQMWPSSPR